ncbi:GNAT family N-acetyltransferase [Microlunatus parietis]|uniref:GNAT superfamily N-acetyltransferase n=1 Tax=Microlunatus parietis TaxID=682979 RepID=A0A7Y9IA50_9ACTN|nr:GNAT family N-acetyltransferase [Microlunatus parietis]NYE72604.1 GNAT superfamily N-acetyltransferase [Microlunatus parietis]
MIRRAAAADADRLASLRRDYGAERRALAPDSDPGFEERFDEWFRRTEGWSFSWLAEVGPKAVGLLTMFAIPRMPTPGRDAGQLAYLGRLFVLPEHRGAGFGSADRYLVWSAN